jgi:hypothetical protein
MGLMLAFLGFLFFDGLLLCSAYNVHHYSFIVSLHNDVHVIFDIYIYIYISSVCLRTVVNVVNPKPELMFIYMANAISVQIWILVCVWVGVFFP